jgi:hypothetical protein
MYPIPPANGATMQIQPVDPANQQLVKAFVEFPYRLYRHEPNWVPPLRVSRQESLDPNKHPAYQHSAAAFFLAEIGKEVVGTLAVIDNQRYNEYTGKQNVFFSFFDCVDDSQVSDGLFAAGFDWAKRCGLKHIIGPRGLIGSESGGVLIEGFEHPAVMEVPYNFEYYHRLIAGAGFEKVTDHLSGTLEVATAHFPERVELMAQRVMQKRGFTSHSFTTIKEILPWVEGIKKAHRISFVNNHEYYPPTEQEYDLVIKNLLTVADPRLIKIVSKGDEVVAFLLAYPDLSDGFQRAKGNLYPFGWLHLLYEKKHSKVMMGNGLAIIPKYRGLGSNALMYVALKDAVLAGGYDRIEGVMVNETNIASKADNETLGMRWYKRHRHYSRAL